MSTLNIGAGDSGSIWTRKERATVLITLSVAKDSNTFSVSKQLSRETNTALNIKDSDVRKKVLKALNKLIPEIQKTKVLDGYIAFSAYDGIWIIRPPIPVTRNFYECGKRFQTDYLKSLYGEQRKIGIVCLSTKHTTISVREGEFEDVKFKLTSGIHGQHKKGGSSSNRFRNIRDMDINLFFKRVHQHMNTLTVDEWRIEGDKDMVKRFKTIG